MKALLKSMLRKVQSNLADKEDMQLVLKMIKDQSNILYNQVAGLQSISETMHKGIMLKPMRGWAVSPDAMVWILAEIQKREKPVVIEFGSGQSTLILAASARNTGGKLYSIEHDPVYMAEMRSQVEASGLSEWVEFIHCPTKKSEEISGENSYDSGLLPMISVDIAFIDGPPPSVMGELTRFVPLSWAVRSLRKNGRVFLDDSKRDSEKKCLQLLKSQFSGLIVQEREAEKGLAEIFLETVG